MLRAWLLLNTPAHLGFSGVSPYVTQPNKQICLSIRVTTPREVRKLDPNL